MTFSLDLRMWLRDSPPSSDSERSHPWTTNAKSLAALTTQQERVKPFCTSTFTVSSKCCGYTVIRDATIPIPILISRIGPIQCSCTRKKCRIPHDTMWCKPSVLWCTIDTWKCFMINYISKAICQNIKEEELQSLPFVQVTW